MSDQPSQAVQDYLKAIHRPRRGRPGRAARPTSPPGWASRPRPSPACSSGSREAGWIEYTPGTGAKLTARGRGRGPPRDPPAPAGRTVPDPVLGLDWSEVDAEAEALEHAISPRLEQAIAAHLGEPLEDPHGHPIPTASGELHHRELQRLSEFRAGQSVVIREAQDDNPDRLRRWRELGLTPGTTVRIARLPAARRPVRGRGRRPARSASAARGWPGLRGEPAGDR